MKEHLIAVGGLALALATGFATSAQADSRAVYDTPDGELVIDYRDADNLRMRVPGERTSFMLVTGGSPYVVAQDDDGWYAIPGEQIAEMAGGGASPDVRVEPLGEQVRVAGVDGALYRLDTGDSWSGEWEEADRIVLTDDPRMRGIGEALRRIGSLFDGIEQDVRAAGLDDADIRDMAPLRTKDMELKSISEQALPDRNFALPPNARERNLRAQAAERPPESGSGEQGGESWLGRTLRETGTDARDEAAGETRNEISDQVRDGIKSLFD